MTDHASHHCYGRGHADCDCYDGPFIVVDADTKRRIRPSRCHSISNAFMLGDRAVRFNPVMDFLVLNLHGEPVPRSVTLNSWLRKPVSA